MDCAIHVVKTKALISFVVTTKLICVFVFAYAKSWFSHDAAHIGSRLFLSAPTKYFFFIAPYLRHCQIIFLGETNVFGSH